MEPQPDRRWANIVGRASPDGTVEPMSFEILRTIADEWVTADARLPEHAGPEELLRTSRSLFAHAWFDYGFMAVACTIALQALEAALRLVYPDAERVPARKLVARTRADGVLPNNIADIADTGLELRNQFSHPPTQSALTAGLAASVLESTHRLVVLLVAEADNRELGGANPEESLA